MLRRTHDRIVAELRRDQERERRAFADERERLLDRIMLLADKPFLPAFEGTMTAAAEPLPEFDLAAYPDLGEPEFD